MRLNFQILSLCFALLGVSAEEVVDGCPKNEYACQDIINSSQCIANAVNEARTPETKDKLIKCVEYEGTVTNIPGASKVSFIEKNKIALYVALKGD